MGAERRISAGLVAVVLLLAGCGGSGSDTGPGPSDVSMVDNSGASDPGPGTQPDASTSPSDEAPDAPTAELPADS